MRLVIIFNFSNERRSVLIVIQKRKAFNARFITSEHTTHCTDLTVKLIITFVSHYAVIAVKPFGRNDRFSSSSSRYYICTHNTISQVNSSTVIAQSEKKTTIIS